MTHRTSDLLCLLKAILVKGLLLVCALSAAAPVYPESKLEPEVEVMHWWHRGADSRALRVLKDEFEARGGIWHNVAGNNSVDVLNDAVSRMARGYAPTLVQWNSAWEVEQIRSLGLLNHVEPAMSDFLRKTLIDNVLDMVQVNGAIVAVPINVHSENWMWFRPGEHTELLQNSVSDWPQFLDYASLMSKQNKVAIAVGNESWQQRILFNNVLLGIAGQAVYQRIYNDLDTSTLSEDAFLEAISIFTQLRQYSESFGEGRWEQQVAAVASNRAMTVSMGDWAKGEFKNLELRLGRDYQCMPAPNTNNHLILTMDVFALGQVDSENEKKGQQLFVEVVTDPDVSETFNYLKGSLPLIKEFNTNSLDKCNQMAYSTLSKKGSAIRPHASIGDRGFIADIDHQISVLWTENTDINVWIEEFSEIIETENGVRTSAQAISSN